MNQPDQTGTVARLFILGGPNGAGKSTLREKIFGTHGIPYVKPAVPKDIKHRQRARLLQALADRCDYAFQSPLDDPVTMLIQQAARAGAEVRMWFVGVTGVERCVARVRARAERGGKGLADEHTRLAYERCFRNLMQLLPFLTELRVYDNSADRQTTADGVPDPVELLHVAGGHLQYIREGDEMPEWAVRIANAYDGIPGLRRE